MPLAHSQPTAEQLAAAEAVFNAKYLTAEPQWSFTLSTILDKSVDEVTSKLGTLDAFEALSKLNPVCIEYDEISRDWINVHEMLCDARVREMPAAPGKGASTVGGGRTYERIHFKAKDRLVAFWGLLSDVIPQRGTYVWDEENKIGLWEVTVIDTPGMETWARKTIKYKHAGDGKTRVEEFVEGYSKEALKVLEGFAKRYTKNLHKGWMNKYHEAL